MNKSLKLLFENILDGKIDRYIGEELLKCMQEESAQEEKEVAIIGISAQIAQADDKDAFWEGLEGGRDFVTFLSEERRNDIERLMAYRNVDNSEMEYDEKAYFDRIDLFDSELFRIPPNDANLMDPNQRCLLQSVYEALEDAGYGGNSLRGSNTGVFVGYEDGIKYEEFIVSDDALTTAIIGNSSAMMAGKVSYYWDLHGPNMVINTACSSSLVALYNAYMSVREKKCDMAIAATVKINLMGFKANRLGIESSNSRTRTFDNHADGSGEGEGAITILLKPLSKAIQEGDHIYAIIRGAGCNQNGHSAGITMPNSTAQEALIRNAWEDAGINPEHLSYIEAHGTGTKIGDPIEIEAIENAFRSYTDKKQFCAVGSVKSNIGHLFHASGLAAVVSVVMALKHKTIYPLIHFQRPNRNIPFISSPVYVNSRRQEWIANGPSRLCAVNSFGFSGTNCHIVMEEMRAEAPTIDTGEETHLFILSAHDYEALERLVQKYAQFCKYNTNLSLKNLCYTASTGRGQYEYRVAMAVDGIEELAQYLDSMAAISPEEYETLSVLYGKHSIVSEDQATRSTGEILSSQQLQFSLQAANLLNAFSDMKKDEAKDKLMELGRLYVKGANIDWNAFYKGREGRRIPLPTYPFTAKRHWTTIPDVPGHVTEDGVNFRKKWVAYDNRLSGNSLGHQVMIVHDRAGFGLHVADILRKQGHNVFDVYLGEGFSRINDNQYVIAADGSGYGELFGISQFRKIGDVIHITTAGTRTAASFAELEENQDCGVKNLFHFAKALGVQRVNTAIRLHLVSTHVFEVTGCENELFPEGSTVFGLGKVLPAEMPNLRCWALDFGDEESMDDLVRWFGEEHEEGIYQYAMRNHQLYVEEIDCVTADSYEDKLHPMRQDGVYIVTGGYSGIGLEMAKYLAGFKPANIVLWGRTVIPPRDLWENVMEAGSDERMCECIAAIREMEEKGSHVICVSADVSDPEQVRVALDKVRDTTCGSIRGIIHSAGIAGDGFLLTKQDETFDKVMKVKVQGAWLLNHMTQDDPIDYFVMISSVAVLLGTPGQGDYTAANAYLNAFEAYLTRNGRRALTVSWGPWTDTGIAKMAKGKELFTSLPPIRYMEQFHMALCSDIRQLYSFSLDYADMQNFLPYKFSSRIIDRISFTNKNDKNDKNERPKEQISGKIVVLAGRDDGAYTETEKNIGQIWCDVLGFEKINIYDEYYELGGDSITGTRIVNRVVQQMNEDVGLIDVLTHSSIYKFSAHIDDKALSKYSDESTDIPIAEEKPYYQLSPAQKRIYILDKIQKVSLSYNVNWVMLMEGELDAERLNAVFCELIKRHESLRTSIEIIDGQPMQKIHSKIDEEMTRISGSEDDLYQLINDFIQPFVMEHAPMIRALLIELEQNKHVLAVDMHHIISDGASVNILIQELYGLYMGHVFSPLRLQYKDYSEWQNMQNVKEQIQKEGAYWKDLLSGEIPKLLLPYDYNMKTLSAYNGERIIYRLEEELSTDLRMLAQRSGATLFMVLLAVLNVALAKYSGQDDILVGIPIEGRAHRDIENIVGVFVNTLVLRNHPQKTKLFNEFLDEVKVNLINAYANQNYPFAELVDWLKAEGRLNDDSLFNVSILLRNSSMEKIDMAGDLSFSPFPFDSKTAKDEMLLEIIDGPSIVIEFEYKTTLFKRESMMRFLDAFARIAQQAAENPAKSLSDFTFSSKEDTISFLMDFLDDLE